MEVSPESWWKEEQIFIHLCLTLHITVQFLQREHIVQQGTEINDSKKKANTDGRHSLLKMLCQIVWGTMKTQWGFLAQKTKGAQMPFFIKLFKRQSITI